MTIYKKICDRCGIRTIHKDAHPGDKEEEFVSVHEDDARGRFLFCRLCEHGHSPADNELDEDLIEEVLDDRPRLVEEMKEGKRTAWKFIFGEVVEAHEKEYRGRYFHPKTTKALLKDYLEECQIKIPY